MVFIMDSGTCILWQLLYLYYCIFIYFLYDNAFLVKKAPEYAVWFNSAYKWINIISVIVLFAILALTITAYFFRKEYWLLGF